jgi:hypothetical protein
MAEEERRKGFKEVRDLRSGRVLLRYDASRDTIEVKPYRSAPVRLTMREVRKRADDSAQPL